MKRNQTVKIEGAKLPSEMTTERLTFRFGKVEQVSGGMVQVRIGLTKIWLKKEDVTAI